MEFSRAKGFKTIPNGMLYELENRFLVSKAVEMARVSAKGEFNLFWGLVASTVISAVGVIVVARLLSPSEYGLVTVALMAPNLVTLFRDWGVNFAIETLNRES